MGPRNKCEDDGEEEAGSKNPVFSESPSNSLESFTESDFRCPESQPSHANPH